MVWVCGGRGMCLTPPGDSAAAAQEEMDWLARYVQGDTHAPVAPGFRFVDQNGKTYAYSSYPPLAGTPVTAMGSGNLSLESGGGSGPVHLAAGDTGFMNSLTAGITPARASHAVDVPIRFSRSALVVGAPQLTLAYRATSPEGSSALHVFAQVVDDSTGLVLGNQATPVPIAGDGAEHTVSVPLEMVVFAAEPGASLTL